MSKEMVTLLEKLDKNKIEQKNECIMSSILIKIINIIKLNLNLINIYLKEKKKLNVKYIE